MRIYITGPAWSGKSTLAERLGKYFHIPVIHLDELQWQTWWMENENYRAEQTLIVAKDDWIIEWSSVSVLKTLQHQVDNIIILNYSPIGNIMRILKRFFLWFLWKKRIGWNGGKNMSWLKWSFLIKTANWQKRQLPRIRANVMECSLESKLIEIDSIENVFEKVISEMKV